MDWLNYHHLLYFHTVAREGSVTRASKLLRLAQPTLSGQIRKLEESLGEKLFARQGRGLTLTETGRIVFRYADDRLAAVLVFVGAKMAAIDVVKVPAPASLAVIALLLGISVGVSWYVARRAEARRPAVPSASA